MTCNRQIRYPTADATVAIKETGGDCETSMNSGKIRVGSARQICED